MPRTRASSPDRGLQAERTALAWTRTSLSVVVSGVLILLRNRALVDPGVEPGGCAARLGIVGTTAVVALAVFAMGVMRRRTLTVSPLPRPDRPRRAILPVGGSVAALSLLVVTYLMLGV